MTGELSPASMAWTGRGYLPMELIDPHPRLVPLHNQQAGPCPALAVIEASAYVILTHYSKMA